MGYWTKYDEAVGERPNRILVEALKKFGGNKRTALDLGAGNLRDSKYLLAEGFRLVTAVDVREPPELVLGVTVVVEAVEKYLPEPNAYDLVSCCNVLYYFPEDAVNGIITRAYDALAMGGILVFNLLAPYDDWVRNGTGRFGYDQVKLIEMLRGMPRTHITRRTGPGKSALGKPRHQDSWRVCVQKPAAQ